MSIFLTEDDRKRIGNPNRDKKFSNLYWGMLSRVKKYSEAPGLSNRETNSDWWHHAAEYITDAALICALKSDESLKVWLRHTVLEIVRRSKDDWIGPFFRNHTLEPASGNLETTHLSIAVAITLDMVPDIFSEEEIKDIKQCLREKAIPLCRQWLKNNRNLANWRCILLAGMAVAAAVIDDREIIAEATEEYNFCLNVIQPDGSYSESLQYSNYCYYGLMMTHEALMRRDPSLKLLNVPYGKAVKWFVHSYLYRKPLTGWGPYPMPRSLNFNDSAAVFGADPDLLMHISATLKDELPEEAGLARWMFDELYPEFPAQGPFDRNTFGFVNRYGFLSIIYYFGAAEAIAPESLPPFAAFSNGQCINRSSWSDSKTVLGFSGSAPDGMYAPGHLHGDINSFIIAYNNERLLVDPGHTCYRSLIHKFDCASHSHNTCTFKNHPYLDSLKQHTCPTRVFTSKEQFDSPVPRGGKLLLAERIDDIAVFANDAGGLYDGPVSKFERCIIMAGEHAFFIIDRIDTDEEMRTEWNWLLNNRDGELEYKVIYPDRIVARRGNAGMKLFNLTGNSQLNGPIYAHVHDAYHPLPQQPGEGAPGSGMLFNWTEKTPAKSRRVIHAITVDDYGIVSGWHLHKRDENTCDLEGPAACCRWVLSVADDAMTIEEEISGRKYYITTNNGTWSFHK